MRIVAIRGQNLASLPAFAVELDREPLADAGVFAIVGPTGAGKSTLLDALCLALFDETPRLSTGRGPRIGVGTDDELGALDRRNVVRRGAAEAMAQVEFIGRDGLRWEATWAVRRAGRGSRKLQAQTLVLKDLRDGRVVASGLTEAKAAIRERLGLDFGQFRRSVVLAQGDFAAFLDAKDAEKAELLERLTGTELYGRLSMGAAEKAAEAKARVAEIQARLADDPPADEETRGALVEAVVQAGIVRDRSAQDQRQAEELVAAMARLAQAERAHAEAQARKDRWDEARGEREADLALDAVTQRAAPHRETVAAGLRARETRDRAQALTAETLEARRLALEAEDRATRALVGAHSAVGAADEARQAASPSLAQARGFDQEVHAALRHAGEVDQEVQRLVDGVEEARRAERLADEALAGLLRERLGAEQTLAELRHRESLAPKWDLVGQMVARFGALGPIRGQASRTLERAQNEDHHQRERLQKAVDERALAQTQAAEAAEQAQSVRQLVDPLAESRLQGERRDHQAQGQALAASREARAQALSAQGAQREAESEARQAQADDLAAAARQTEVEAEGRAVGAALLEAQAARDRVRAALSMADHRALLVDGQPCPLCGALEHPFALNPALVGLIDDQTRAVQRLEERQGVLRSEWSLLVSRRSTAAERAAQAGRRASDAAERLRNGAIRWANAGLVPELEVLADGSEEALAEAQGRWEQSDRALGEAERALVEARRRLAEAEAEVARAGKRLIQAQSALDLARGAAEKANADRIQAEAGLGALEQERARLEGNLSLTLGDEMAALRADPQGLHERLTAEVGRWSRARDAWTKAREAAEPATVARDAARERARAKAADLAEARGRQGAAHQRLADLRLARAALLGGRPVDDVERGLHEALQSAQSALTQAQTAQGVAYGARRAAEAASEAAAQRLSAAQLELEASEESLQAALQAFGGDEEALRIAATRELPWREALQRRIQAAAEEGARLDGALIERQQRLADERSQAQGLQGADPERHSPEAAPVPTQEQAEALLQLRKSDAQAAEQALSGARFALDRDDRARERASGWLTERAARAAVAARWERLDALIGQKDGGKFRRFAQGLTLATLVHHANDHLRDLAPRYQLVHLADAEYPLALAVRDGALADELRPTTGLSGGERFLVSLALALGLSALRGQDARIESLFIDEGFGNLDAATLDAAVSALMALRSTGRQIGVISHVEGLADALPARVEVRRLSAATSEVFVSRR